MVSFKIAQQLLTTEVIARFIYSLEQVYRINTADDIKLVGNTYLVLWLPFIFLLSIWSMHI